MENEDRVSDQIPFKKHLNRYVNIEYGSAGASGFAAGVLVSCDPIWIKIRRVERISHIVNGEPIMILPDGIEYIRIDMIWSFRVF